MSGSITPFPSPPQLPMPSVFGNPGANLALSTVMVGQTNTFLQQLQANAAAIVPPVINPNFPTIATAPVPVTASMPSLVNVTWTVPPMPGAFTQPPPDLGAMPGPFTGSAPPLSLPTAPTPAYGAAPTSPGVQTDFTFPTLSLNLPSAPALLSVSNIQFDGVTLPTFTAEMPVLQIASPQVIDYSELPVYSSTLLGYLKTDLENAISKGMNLDLPDSIYTAKWDSARERAYRQQQDAIDELERMETMGFAFPPGVYTNARLKVITETQNTIEGLNREIMIKSAELTLENLVKAREQSTLLEGKLVDYYNSVCQRTLEAAKYKTEANVQVYNAGVAAFTARMEGYKAAAQVYDYQIRGSLAVAEIYKTEVEAELAKAQIDQALVANYRTLQEAELAKVDIYKTEVQAIEVQANIQKLLVEIYGEQIKAYVGRVNAFSAEVEAYKAGVQGQVATQEAYKTAVEAYKVEVDAGVAVTNARIEQYKSLIAAYTAQLDAYRAAVTGMAEQARAAGIYNTSAAEVFKAETQGLSAYNETLTKQWQAVIDTNERVAEVAVKAAEAQGQMYIAAHGLQNDAIKGAAQVASQLGAAALNAIHFTNSASWSTGTTSSYSQSNAWSFSESVATSTSQNYNENSSV